MVLKLSGSHRHCKPSTGATFVPPNPHQKPDDRLKKSAAPLGLQDVGGFLHKARDASFNVLLEDDHGEPKEWMALVEPGVLITFVSLPGGAGNDLKRIRFREMFNKWQAQRWWGENYDRIMELYNVQSFSRQGLNTPSRSEDDVREGTPAPPPPPPPPPTEKPCHGGGEPDGGSRTTTSSRDEGSASSEPDAAEWVMLDAEPGVFVTVRQQPDGSRELRRVKFSRQHFSEARAKQWWEENWERIQAQYL